MDSVSTVAATPHRNCFNLTTPELISESL